MKRVALGTLLLFLATYAYPCSTIALPTSPQKWVLKSYDWHQSHGTIFTNPKGLKKTAFHPTETKLADWTAKYGSLTFNQHGRELPLGGVNEAGLVIEIMWLKGSKYGEGSSGKYVNELQWIQYHLDKFSKVKEVTKSALELGIASVYAKVHYMVCDADGDCATLDFLDGKPPVIHEGKDLATAPVLTNETYASSLMELKEYQEFGGTRPTPGPKAKEPYDRFVKGAVGVLKYKNDTETPVDDVMGILKSVSAGDYTKFNIAYDRKAQKVHFRTLVRPALKSIDLTALDFRCHKGARALNMNLRKEGDVTTEFEAYTQELNTKLVEDGLKEISGLLPKGALEKLATYPATLKCE